MKILQHPVQKIRLFNLKGAGQAGRAAKNFRVIPRERQAAKAADRGAHHGGVRRFGQRAIFTIHLRFQFRDEKGLVIFKCRVRCRSPGGVMAAAVFPEAPPTVVHRDHDDLLHFPGAAEGVHGPVQFPTAPAKRAVRPGGTENVLAVLQI